MGNGTSRSATSHTASQGVVVVNTAGQVNVNRSIDDEIKKDRRQALRTIKLLILGAGECGKSTIIKQMRIIHAEGFNAGELRNSADTIRSNTVEAMVAILNARESFKTPFVQIESASAAQTVTLSETIVPSSESQLAEALATVWRDAAVKSTVLRRAEYQLIDSAEYFFESIARIFAKDYTPTVQDILMMRQRTTGIHELNITVQSTPFRVFDVGGQRTERRKWIHCFDNVNAVIFVIAISEFDQLLWEDNKTNRLIEAIRLYENVTTIPWFQKISFINFLNKRDLFADKLAVGKSLASAFPDYPGALGYMENLEYVKARIQEVGSQGDNDDEHRSVFMHETCATDTDQVQQVIDAVFDIIISANLGKSGLD